MYKNYMGKGKYEVLDRIEHYKKYLHKLIWQNNDLLPKILYEAIRSDDLEAVEILTSNEGIDINAKYGLGADRTFLGLAATRGNPDIVNKILGLGANIEDTFLIIGKGYFSPLWVAVDEGKEKIVEILLAHGANSNPPIGTYDYSPLHVASEKGMTSIVGMLLARGADVNKIGGIYERTPLSLALMNTGYQRYNEVLKLSVMGVKLDAKNCNDPSVLEVVKLLVEHGARLDLENYNDCSALKVVTTKVLSYEVANYLIDKGANAEGIINEVCAFLASTADYRIYNSRFYAHLPEAIKCVKKLLNQGFQIEDKYLAMINSENTEFLGAQEIKLVLNDSGKNDINGFSLGDINNSSQSLTLGIINNKEQYLSVEALGEESIFQ